MPIGRAVFPIIRQVRVSKSSESRRAAVLLIRNRSLPLVPGEFAVAVAVAGSTHQGFFFFLINCHKPNIVRLLACVLGSAKRRRDGNHGFANKIYDHIILSSRRDDDVVRFIQSQLLRRRTAFLFGRCRRRKKKKSAAKAGLLQKRHPGTVLTGSKNVRWSARGYRAGGKH